MLSRRVALGPADTSGADSLPCPSPASTMWSDRHRCHVCRRPVACSTWTVTGS
ncbi:hypothetical protein HMPREF9056_00520 [Actinomyces sp. oral taxon 170 str. F0386]|nr:hypothetical protein HMPREF9056_00520 [Actinomyces sp. oral taxon 170 str. F0386]